MHCLFILDENAFSQTIGWHAQFWGHGLNPQLCTATSAVRLDMFGTILLHSVFSDFSLTVFLNNCSCFSCFVWSSVLDMVRAHLLDQVTGSDSCCPVRCQSSSFAILICSLWQNEYPSWLCVWRVDYVFIRHLYLHSVQLGFNLFLIPTLFCGWETSVFLPHQQWWDSLMDSFY